MSGAGDQDLWERIKEFNANFDYKRGDELGLWAMIMRKQVEEIDEHLDEDRPGKVVREFIDCVLVGQQAVILGSDEDVDEVLIERIRDIESRVDEVETYYSGGDRATRTDGGHTTVASRGSATKVTVRVPASMLEDVDALVERGVYPNRSEVVRAAVASLLEDAGHGGDRDV